MLHEIIRQSLILPCSNSQYRDITRGAIHILGVWILGSEDERPSFLRRSGGSGSAVTRSSSTASVSNSTDNVSIISSSRAMSTSPISEEPPLPPLPQPAASTKTANEEEYSDANTFLRRYLLMIKLIFEDRTPRKSGGSRDMMVASVQQVTDWEGLVALYKDAINVYRAIAVSKGGIEIEWESWELLLQCLLDIQQWFMSQPEKYSRIPVQSLAEELADYIWEVSTRKETLILLTQYCPVDSFACLHSSQDHTHRTMAQPQNTLGQFHAMGASTEPVGGMLLERHMYVYND